MRWVLSFALGQQWPQDKDLPCLELGPQHSCPVQGWMEAAQTRDFPAFALEGNE